MKNLLSYLILSIGLFSLCPIGAATNSSKSKLNKESTKKSATDLNITQAARNQSNKVVRIGWVYAMANAPLIVAQHKGFFQQQGVQVKLTAYKSGPLLKKDLKAGRLDLAYIGVPPVYHWYTKGLKSKIIAKVNYGQASVIVRRDSKFKNVKDLRNHKFAGVRKGSGMDVLLRGFVLGEKGHLTPKRDVKILTMKPETMGAAIESNKVSGAFTWEPFTSLSVLRGKTRIIMDISKEIPRYPWYVVMAMPEAIKNKRPEIIKVLKAHRKAVAFLNSAPNAGDNLIARVFKLKPVKIGDKTVHNVSDILAQARTRLGWQDRLTGRDTKFMQRLMDYSYKLGYIKQKLNVDDLVDISFMYDVVVN